MAALAPAVLAEAQAGDRVARTVVEQAAASLTELAVLVITELGIAGQGYPLIGAGGVIQGGPLYWQILSGQICAYDPTLVPVVPPVKAAVGAAFVALAAAGVAVTAELRDRVVATQEAFPEASMNMAGKTSMELGVRVEAENLVSGEVRHTSSAYLSFVALDENGKPKAVPALLLETDDEIRRNREALMRRKMRLELRAAQS